jgi:hypothetical protein
MRSVRVTFAIAVAAAGALFAGGNAVSAAPAASVPGISGPMILADIGSACPGFAPYIPEDLAAGTPGVWWSGYFSWPAGEYLVFQSVSTNPGDVIKTEGSGAPWWQDTGWTPTSDHTYKVIGRLATGDPLFDYGRLSIVRDDGAKVSGDIQIQIDQNHGWLIASWASQPACRLH